MLPVLLLALAGLGCSAEPAFLAEHGIEYRLEVRKDPRPLRLHWLKIDLANPRVELAAAIGDDPDGDGPATAVLTPPGELARRAGAIAMVNANPWQSTPDAAGNRTTLWRKGMPVEALGLAATGGRLRAKPMAGHCGFWVGKDGRWRVGAEETAGPAEMREGVAGFLQLVKDGRVVREAGGPIHPRTALGLDGTGRWLYLLVVDGRQAGYSEGMSYHELADTMLAAGCRDAVNLDGGGSSIMILADAAGRQRVVNDPSTKALGVSLARPIPVALVVREKR